jgi:hypothetical protein
MYGIKDNIPNPKLILNDGGKQFDEKYFANSYQNDQCDGKKSFLILWLHAYKYTIPAFIT